MAYYCVLSWCHINSLIWYFSNHFRIEKRKRTAIASLTEPSKWRETLIYALTLRPSVWGTLFNSGTIDTPGWSTPSFDRVVIMRKNSFRFYEIRYMKSRKNNFSTSYGLKVIHILINTGRYCVENTLTKLCRKSCIGCCPCHFSHTSLGTVKDTVQNEKS